MSLIYKEDITGESREANGDDWNNNFHEIDDRLTANATAAGNAISRVFTAASEAAMLALSARKGDMCKRTDGDDPKKLYQLNDADATTLSNWVFVAIYTLPAIGVEVTIPDVTGLPEALDLKADLVDGKVPSAQLPSYVDDVLEVANYAALPGNGEAGIIYVTLDTNKEYRWSGSAYIEIVASPGSTDAVPEGSTNKYYTDARTLAAVLAGLDLDDPSAITAADNILAAFGKLQKQITDANTAIDGKEPTIVPVTGWTDPVGTPLRADFNVGDYLDGTDIGALAQYVAGLITDLKAKGILAT